MSQMFTIQIEKPIAAIKLLNDMGMASSTAPGEARDAEATGTENFSPIYQALKDAVNKINGTHKLIFKEYRENIAKLAVEIARKILMQKADEGDYKIEQIVEGAMKSSPTLQDIMGHLNPDDFSQCQKLQQDDTAGTFAGVAFISDQNVGRAECIVETPKGNIESLMSEHLQQISEAFSKA